MTGPSGGRRAVCLLPIYATGVLNSSEVIEAKLNKRLVTRLVVRGFLIGLVS